MSHNEPGYECPECGTKLFGRKCMQCGWNMKPISGEVPITPPVLAWTCDRCRSRTSGIIYAHDGPNGSPRGLCSTCHFDERIRPYKSNADDLCTAPECEGQAPHKVSRHITLFRQHVARIQERMEGVKL